MGDAETQTVAGMIPPGLLLTENDRLHWAQKADRVRDLNQLGKLVYGRRLRPVRRKTRVIVTLYFPLDAAGRRTGKRRRDPANWAPTAKALVDGMTLAHVWPDDSHEWVEGPDLRLGGDSPDPLRAQIVVTLQPVEAATPEHETPELW